VSWEGPGKEKVMKNLRNHLIVCAGAFVVLALSLLISCDGGGGEVTVTPEVHVGPDVTWQEQLVAQDPPSMFTGVTVDWLAPDRLQLNSSDDRIVWGVNSAVVSYWDLSAKKMMQVPVEVVGGSITHAGAGILDSYGKCTVSGIDVPVGSSRDSSISVTGLTSNDPVALWLRLNDIDPAGVTYTTKDGQVHWEGEDNLLIIPIPLPILPVAAAVCSVSSVETKTVSATVAETRKYTFTRKSEVTPPPTHVLVSVDGKPDEVSVLVGGTQQFTATARDDAGTDITSSTVFTWSIVSGNGTITQAGLFTAGNAASDVTIKVTGNWSNITKSDTIEATVTEPVENQSPTANIDADKTSGTAPLTVNFDASASTDPDGTIAGYAWDLNGDDVTDATTVSASHAYPAGTHVVKLTVTDNDGKTDSATVTITVTEPPVGDIIWPIGDDSPDAWYTDTGSALLTVGVAPIVGYVEWIITNDPYEGMVEKTSEEPCCLVRYWPGTWPADVTEATITVEARAHKTQADYLDGKAALDKVVFTIHMTRE
jgi:PKD repeat protein